MKRISEEYDPVRKAQTVYGSISGNYSFRGEKTIWFESTLERDYLIRQEFNNNVIDVVSQPISIPYVTDLGNASTYTPDFLVQYSSASYDDLDQFPAPLLIEIKPRKPSLGYMGYRFRVEVFTKTSNSSSATETFIINSETDVRIDPFFYDVVSHLI